MGKIIAGQRYGHATFFPTSDQGQFSKCIRDKIPNTMWARTKHNAKTLLEWADSNSTRLRLTSLEREELKRVIEYKADK